MDVADAGFKPKSLRLQSCVSFQDVVLSLKMIK